MPGMRRLAPHEKFVSSCFMISDLLPDGGGNALAETSIIVRRTAALGDTLCASVIADKLAGLGHSVRFQAHGAMHCILRRRRSITSISDVNGYCDVDLDGAYEHDPYRRRKHFHEMFVSKANQQLQRQGINLGAPTNCKPHMTVTLPERETARAKFNQYPRPWVFVCPRSESYAVRRVADGVWKEIAERVRGTKFWLGFHPAPKGFVDLKVKHFDNVIVWLSVADMLITVDTGPMHVAAALGIPVVAIAQSSFPSLHLNDQNDYIELSPKLDCLNCQKNLCPINEKIPPCNYINPEFVASWANARLSGQGMVSVVIPTYNAPAERLNRCIAAVLNQADEIIVSVDVGGKVAEGAMRHEKVRYVHRPLGENAFGRNCNFGARHTNGEFIWFLNDDCFVEPNCAEAMLACMAPGVGMVGHLLYYPDRRIYCGGKYRDKGQRG